jgi:hypothetical protein
MDLEGNTVERLPLILGPPVRQGSGMRELTTGSYAPGTYRVRAEMTFGNLDGETVTAVSPWTELTVPPRAPGERPTVRHFAPTVASRGPSTRVTLEFTLSAGFEFLQSPYVVALNAGGHRVNYTSAYIDQRAPEGKAHRDLKTEVFPPGTYFVRGELTYRDPDGQTATVVSPWTELIVPAPDP